MLLHLRSGQQASLTGRAEQCARSYLLLPSLAASRAYCHFLLLLVPPAKRAAHLNWRRLLSAPTCSLFEGANLASAQTSPAG